MTTDEIFARLAELGVTPEQASEGVRRAVRKPRAPYGTTGSHDPGDEDRSVDAYCRNCGDPFDRDAENAAVGQPSGAWRPCPNPSPGRPLVDCGVGGHMYDDRRPADVATLCVSDLDMHAFLHVEPSSRCAHIDTKRGKDAPKGWGSHRTEVCRTCGAFRTHGHDPARSHLSAWRPAGEYADATAEHEDM